MFAEFDLRRRYGCVQQKMLNFVRYVVGGAVFALMSSGGAQAQEAVPQEPALQGSGTAVATSPTQPAVSADVLPMVAVTDEERAAVVVAGMSLDLHLIPAQQREDVHATLTLKNVSATPMARIPLQISGTLRWQAVTAMSAGRVQTMAFTQSPIATDADHTGFAQEAILTPSQPLVAGATLMVSVVYAGEIKQSAARIEVLGTDPAKAALLDWDQIGPTTDQTATALRGFGNVLWYPVAAPVALLGEGNKLFEITGKQRALNVGCTMRLRLTVEYVGDPPDAAIVNGRMVQLIRTSDSDVDLIENARGLATAEVPAGAIGYRIPSIFLTAQRAVTTPDQLLTVVTPHVEGTEPYATAAAQVQALLAMWLGANPVQPLLLLDRFGERYETGAFIAGELMSQKPAAELAPDLVRGLTHAWLPAGVAPLWLDQGLPEFMSLLWTERTRGREAAIAELQHASTVIALVEPGVGTAGQPLVSATSEVFLRFKSAYVIWQLRELLGEDVFRKCLMAYRQSLMANAGLMRDGSAFERSIERTSGKDLGWFFHDWVDGDLGLPDLSIVQATPRPLPARPGKSAGYLVAVEVRNDGEAEADVPVTVRAVVTSATERLRVGPHSSASVRILFEDTPETVQVNDGSVPELRATVHMQAIQVAAKP